MPQPPVASIVFGDRTAYISPVALSITYAPTHLFSPAMPSRFVIKRSIAITPSRTSIPGVRLTRLIIADSHFSPVMSPAWSIRRELCPPSRVRSHEPSRFFANFTPQSMRSRIPSGACSHISCTTLVSPSHAPAIIVSRAWRSKVSDGSITQHIPPCAKFVLQSASRPFVTRVTLPYAARCSALMRPAMPDPTTK